MVFLRISETDNYTPWCCILAWEHNIHAFLFFLQDYTTLAENYEKLAGTSECLYSFIHVLCTLSLTLQKQMTSGRYSLPQKVTVQLNNQDDHIYTPKCISVVFVTALLSVFTSVGSDVRM